MKAYSAFLQAFRRITEFSCFDGKEDTGAATGSNCKNWRSMEPKSPIYYKHNRPSKSFMLGNAPSVEHVLLSRCKNVEKNGG